MSNAEDHIPKDEDTGLSRDEPSIVSTGDKEHGSDLSELYQLLGESTPLDLNEPDTVIPAQGETTSIEDVHDVSVMDELEALYGGSAESNTDEAEAFSKNEDSVTDSDAGGVDILEELEALYGGSAEPKTDEAEISSNNEESVTETVSDDVSIMKELEALYGDSAESQTSEAEVSSENDDSVTDRDAGGVDILEELGALYGGSDESTADDAETSSVFKESVTESITDGVDVLEELGALYGGSDESATDDAETTSINEESITESVSDDVSVMAELEVLYGGSDESTTDDAKTSSIFEESVTESITDGVDVLEELGALYSGSDESATDETVTSSINEESMAGSVFDADSGLEELGTLLESSVNSVTDEVELPSETSEHFSTEEDAGGMSALEELRVFLGEVVQPQAEESGDLYSTSQQEHLSISRRSVLDELQQLLQSSIDELKAAADGNIEKSPASTGVEYPSYDELKNLLESTLDQLMMISDSSTATDYSDSGSVLDELHAILGEASNNISMTDTSMTTDEPDDLLEGEADIETEEITTGVYVSSVESGYESSFNDEVAGVGTYTGELEALLGESAGTDIESSMISSESADTTTVAYDESHMLDEFEGLLSGSTGTAESDVMQDGLTTSVPDTENADNPVVDSSRYQETNSSTDVSDESHMLDDIEGLQPGSTETIESEVVPDYSTTTVPDTETADNPVIDELEPYMDYSSRHLDDDKTTDVSDESYMLDDLAGSLSGPTGTAESDVVQDDSTTSTPDAEAGDNPVLVELESYLNDSSRRLETDTTTSTEEPDTDSDNLDSTVITLEQLEALRDKPAGSENNETSKKIKVIECDFTVEHEVSQQFGAYDDETGKDTRKFYDKTQQVEAEEDGFIEESSTENVYISHENKGNKFIPIMSILSVAAVVAGVITLWNLLDTGDGPEYNLATTKTGLVDKPVTVKSETEFPARVVDEPAIPAMHEQTPVSIDRDEPLVHEENVSNIEMDVYHVEQPEITDEIPDNRLVESINEQEENHQENNIGNIDQMKTSLAEAESSTERLQEEKSSENDEFAELLLSGQSGSSEQFESPVAELTYDNAPGMENNVWSVHLSAYYSEPPPDIELEYLKEADIHYEIIKVILDGKVWYRVLVDGFLQYREAKEYAEMMESKFGIKKIWISNVQKTLE